MYVRAAMWILLILCTLTMWGLLLSNAHASTVYSIYDDKTGQHTEIIIPDGSDTPIVSWDK